MVSLGLAYGLVWFLLAGYIFFLQRKQRRLEQELEMVKEMLWIQVKCR